MSWKSALGVIGFFVTREKDKAIIDDIPFQLQYKYSTSLLFVFQFLLTLSELIGKHQYFYAKFFLMLWKTVTKLWSHNYYILGKGSEKPLSCWTTSDRLKGSPENYQKYVDFLCWVRGTYVREKTDLGIDTTE